MQFDLQQGSVYFRDNFVPFNEANISIASSPVLYGLSIYTVFSVNKNDETGELFIFRLGDHYRRLVRSAQIMDFHSFAEEWSFDRFKDTMLELLKRNNVNETVLVRATVFIDELVAGTRIHGLKNSFCAYVYPMGEILKRSGVNVCVSSWQRTPDNAMPSRAKVNGSYINASLMKNEALLNGFDEAIALDHLGHVTEGTVANLFMVRDKQIITPDASSDILEGITRDSVIEIVKQKLEMELVERPIDRSELYMADELFFCGSSASVTPILSVDHRPIDGGREAGPVTNQIAKFYHAAQTGRDETFQPWLTRVE